jgi:hypothetical protein
VAEGKCKVAGASWSSAETLGLMVDVCSLCRSWACYEIHLEGEKKHALNLGRKAKGLLFEISAEVDIVVHRLKVGGQTVGASRLLSYFGRNCREGCGEVTGRSEEGHTRTAIRCWHEAKSLLRARMS